MPKADSLMPKADSPMPKADSLMPKADSPMPKADSLMPSVGIRLYIDYMAYSCLLHQMKLPQQQLS